MRRGYAGMLSLWVQHTLRGRVFDSIQKLDGAGRDALRTGQVISRTNSDLQQVHTLLQMCQCRWQCSLITLPALP
uniref:ABC transmembrane type-1 domain-containing protein n=1 Tax=Escherichia coli TaxID=562 RepID=A0A811ARA6_ECOLX|nr:hypothetical protein [Escherichia coli]